MREFSGSSTAAPTGRLRRRVRTAGWPQAMESSSAGSPRPRHRGRRMSRHPDRRSGSDVRPRWRPHRAKPPWAKCARPPSPHHAATPAGAKRPVRVSRCDLRRWRAGRGANATHRHRRACSRPPGPGASRAARRAADRPRRAASRRAAEDGIADETEARIEQFRVAAPAAVIVEQHDSLGDGHGSGRPGDDRPRAQRASQAEQPQAIEQHRHVAAGDADDGGGCDQLLEVRELAARMAGARAPGCLEPPVQRADPAQVLRIEPPQRSDRRAAGRAHQRRLAGACSNSRAAALAWSSRTR